MPTVEQRARHPHLQLVAENRSADRRTHPAPPAPPPPRQRTTFAPALNQAVSEAVAAAVSHTKRGFHPNLVLRIPLARGVPVDTFVQRLREVDILPVSIEPDRAVVAFREGTDLSAFRGALAAYAHGPAINQKTAERFKTTKWDVFEFIETLGLREWGRGDRLGSRLGEMLAVEPVPSDKMFTLDVELWHRGSRDLAAASLQELRELISRPEHPANRLHDTFTGEQMCLARVTVDYATVESMLELDVISEMELPPVPVLFPNEVRRSTPKDYAPLVPPSPEGPAVCVVDSGVAAGHPLLQQHVADASSFLKSTTSAADPNGHGTMVAGLATFGSIRACYSSGVFASPVRLYSARVLNDQNQFEEESLVVRQTEEAIRKYYQAPYNCRVFNLSVGSSEPAFRNGYERQTIWAERIDYLCRVLKIVVVVSAGNYSAVFTARTDEAEQFHANYPAYLLEHEARLNDPSTAAIAVTVGAIAEHDIPALRQGLSGNDIMQPIAKVDQPSPFTRAGLGLNGAIKPEFVEYGGNAVFSGTSNSRRVTHEHGTAVMSLSNRPLEQLFAFNAGTSLAAPLVSRRAAMTWKALEVVLQTSVDSNLVRAVLGVSARRPVQMVEGIPDESNLYRFAGYGQIDEQAAFSSSDRHVTMVAQGRQKIDTFNVFAVPVPAVMVGAPGWKSVRVALAYDPPVRRRRTDYLGVEMTFQMIRGKSLDEVIASFRALDPDRDTNETIGAPFAIPFEPKGKPRKAAHKRASSTLQVGEFRFKQGGAQYTDTYWLVVRSQRRWAPTPEFEVQDYGIAVSLTAETDELYAKVEARLWQSTRLRTRA